AGSIEAEDDHAWQRSTSRHHGDRPGFPVPVPAVSTEVRELQSGSPSISRFRNHQTACSCLTKHGALSVPDGRVRLEWDLIGEGEFSVFHLRWEEKGGPPAEEPKQSGFGSVLIGRIVPKMLGGKCDMRFLEAGFAYELTGPGTPFRRASNVLPAK
ncbi:MAG TPA: hypothetical protein VFY53_01195, partial [Rhodoplanes sp.]|nr:hypothetical protein [Rhodoplanes sp.]